jgi:hypothetical protein
MPQVVWSPSFGEVEAEVDRCLPRIGLPSSPATPARYFICPEVINGRASLDQVNWEAAVRQGTRNVVVRGFSRPMPVRVDSAEWRLRSAVRNGVISGLNRAAGEDAAGLTKFQALVQQGVEDALTEAFNELGAHELGAPASSALPNQTRRHYAGGLADEAFHERYVAVELVDAGWIVDQSARPLTGTPEYLVLTLRDRDDQVEIWSNGRLLADHCRFARYFDEARRRVP